MAPAFSARRNDGEGLLLLLDPSQQTSRWTALADAAWDEVLLQLHPGDVPNARLVCRAWYQDVSRCLHSLHLVEPSGPMLANLAASFPRLTALKAVCCSPARSPARSGGGARAGSGGGGSSGGVAPASDDPLQDAAGLAPAGHPAAERQLPLSFPNLHCLSLQGYSAAGLKLVSEPLPSRTIPGVPYQPPFAGQRVLTAPHHTWHSMSRRVRSSSHHAADVSDVEDEERGQVMASVAQLLSSCCSTLAHLELRDCLVIGGLQALQSCPRLSSLKLLGCRFPTAGPSPLACLSSLASLRTLELRTRPKRGTFALAADTDTVSFAPDEPLCLDGLSLLTSLRSLSLEVGQDDAVRAVPQVAALSLLESLEVSVLPQGLHQLFELDVLLPTAVVSLPRLTKLEVNGHTAVHDRHLHLLSQLPALQSLSLSLPSTPCTPDSLWWGHPVGPYAFHHAFPPLPDAATPFEAGWPVEGLSGEAMAALLSPQKGAARGRGGLRSLALGNVPLTAAAVAAVGAVRGLEVLNVSGVRLIDDAFLFRLASLPHLTQLSLAGCANVSNIGLAHLAKRGSQLQWLDVSGCNPHVSDLGIAKLGALRKLQHLVAICMDRMTDAGVAGLVQQPHRCALKSLDLSLGSRMSSKALHALAAHAPDLASLSIDCCDRITASGVAALLASCHGLRELSAQHCHAAVQRAAEALPYYASSAQRRKARQYSSQQRAWWMAPV